MPVSVLTEVEKTLSDFPLKSTDAGLAELARNLAGRIDDEKSGRTAAELAAKLTTILVALTDAYASEEVPSDSRLGKLRSLPGTAVREA